MSGNLNANGHYMGNYVKKHIIVDVNGHKVGICGSTTQVENGAVKASVEILWSLFGPCSSVCLES